MNVFSYELARESIDPQPELSSERLVIDDNIGESVHIHLRNTRIEMSVSDYNNFAKNVNKAVQNLNNGDN